MVMWAPVKGRLEDVRGTMGGRLKGPGRQMMERLGSAQELRLGWELTNQLEEVLQ